MTNSRQPCLWGTNPVGGRAHRYGGRTHVVLKPGQSSGLCGLPVETVSALWRHGARLCPECCIAAMASLFPPADPSRMNQPFRYGKWM
jgi:hypothetical protein